MRLASHLATLAALIAIGLALGRWLREPNAGGLVFLLLVCAAVAAAVRHLYRSAPDSPERAPRPERTEGPEPAEPGPARPADHRVDLNAATLEDLVRLPGVGPVAAQRILDEREAGGPFASVDDLVRVPGFGPAKVRVLAPDARCGPPRRASDQGWP